MDKKRLFLWSLYDFANSIVWIIFFLYFSQWLVVEMGVKDIWYNLIFTISSVLLLLTAPIAASIADKTKIKMPGLRITTFLSFLFFFLTGIIAVSYPTHYVYALIFSTLAMYFYLFCFTYYHPLLSDIATPEKQGLASGWGIFGNEMGQIFGILISIPLATGTIILFNSSLRAQTLVPSAVLFFLFSLPMLIFFKEKNRRQDVLVDIKQEYKNIIHSIKEIFKIPDLGRFFLAYFFFNDAIITASNNFAIYLDRVFNINDTLKSLVLIGIILVGSIGAVVGGWISDRIGWKKTLDFLLIGWIIIFPILAIMPNFYIFLIFVSIMGIWWGAIWSVTRVAIIKLTPLDKLDQSFTFYTLMERFSTFVGPISWSIIVVLLSNINGLNYKIAMASMGVFCLIGFLISSKIKTR